MSYIKPITPTFLNLKNVEDRIQNIQLYLKDNLSWLEYSFGLVDRLTQQRDEPYVFPAVYLSNTEDPFDCMPSDIYNYCFWTVEDLAELSYDDEFSIRKDGLVKYEASVIFFLNLAKIATTTAYNVTRSLCRKDIMDAINSMSGVNCFFVPENYIENDMTRIFDGFSVSAIDNIKKQLPFWAIRVNGSLSFRLDC